MPRKNFPSAAITAVGITATTLVTAGAAETITIRTITAANVSNPLVDAFVTIGYRDSSSATDHVLASKIRLPVSGPYSSCYTMDIGQVLEPNDYLWALSDVASAVDVTGSYEV